MHVVVLGAGYAGVMCALRVARESRGRVQVTLVNAESKFVERIRLHEQLTTGVPPCRNLAELVTGTGVRLLVARAERIDIEAQTVWLEGHVPLAWDRLVLALGSRVERSGTEGVEQHAFTLDRNSTARLSGLLPQLAVRRGRVVVVGGGLTGLEAATELAERWPGLRVTLVARGRLAEGWSSEARAHVLGTLARLGVDLREEHSVDRIDAHSLSTDRGPLEHDACLWCVGFVASPLARAAGLAVNALGQVEVDACLRSTSHPDIYAVGDMAVAVESVGDPMPMGCKSALPAGAHAGVNLTRLALGEPERPLAFRSPFFCVSLGRRDGLIQGRARDQSLRGRVLKGRAGAWFKELICRGTVWVLRLEGARARLAHTLRAGIAPVQARFGRSSPGPRLLARPLDDTARPNTAP
jgi:NADH dehydrogenase